MSERTIQAVEADHPTPVERAERIAHSLARLAHLVAQPQATHSLPTIAAQLATMAVDLRQVASTLNRGDDPGPSVQQHGAEAALLVGAIGQAEATALLGPVGPVNAGKELADAEPLTWRAIPEAVKSLSRLAALAVAPDATMQERLAAAENAAAARRLQRLVEALAPLLAALGTATALHRTRSAKPPSVEASAEIAVGIYDFTKAFADLVEGGALAPSMALAMMLADVQSGHRALFSPPAHPQPHHSTRIGDADSMGAAACALDARHRASPSRNMILPAQEVADAISHQTGERIRPVTVKEWRARCQQTDRNDPKGFKQNHRAYEVWQHYRSEVVPRLERMAADGQQPWLDAARHYEQRAVEAYTRKQEVIGRERATFPSVAKTG